MNTSTPTVPQSKPAVAVAPPPPPAPPRHVFKLGLDVDLRSVVTATQCDHGAIKPAQKLTRKTSWAGAPRGDALLE